MRAPGRSVSEQVRIVEVSPRDGLQNESTILSTATKLALIQNLIAAGCTRIEVSSFVSPKAVPALADATDVVTQLGSRAGLDLIALVPNERLVRLVDLHADHMQHVRTLTLDTPEMRDIVLRNLEQVMMALRVGDSEGAARAMLEHLAGAKRAYIAAVGLDRESPQPEQETTA